ncbi:MAG: RNA methyltransferase, partial [Acetatifactor sp.]|nr:RNA methyltransferase [Acetatifactor sp.]
DPGNLGTILRTGEGAGITGVIMSKGTVDIFNPKTIRSTMGSVYRVPFVYVEDLEETIKILHRSGIHTYAAHLKGEEYYDSFSFCEPTAFLIGNEGNGLKKETADLAEKYLKIPMEGKVESLNAGIATALLIYEAHRQRNKN